ncbi:hypothetical protein AN619_23570 [Thermotalea metallivorans]|uniref:Uncharacterized protein n=1 Tax=Thermotalea metallivorans TaxID=520762 RepID=A0A140L1N4_9FIRM|nr:hypothetical protein AN619_23570 [Thermotalea metallivorans]
MRLSQEQSIKVFNYIKLVAGYVLGHDGLTMIQHMFFKSTSILGIR